MRKKGKRALLWVVAAVMLVALLPATGQAVNAATAEELQEQRAALQEQLKEINRKLADIKDETKKAQEKANTYYERKNIVENQIYILQQSVDIKTEELTAKQEELDLKEKEREETYERFKQRLRAMYMSNSSSSISALLGASSFSDFLMQSEILRRVSEHDTQLVEKLEQEGKEIEVAKLAIEEELESLEADKAELDAKYNELAILYQEANEELTMAQALQSATQNDYDAILEAIEQTNREWNALMGNGEADQIGSGVYAWPVPGFSWISSGFGPRTLYGQYNYHTGIDIAGSGVYGARVQASDSGKVVLVRYYTTGYGYHVMIDHGANNWTVYAHLSSIAVVEGQYVNLGDTVGYVGSTGNSTGPHLHFEVRINGSAVNPTSYVSYY